MLALGRLGRARTWIRLTDAGRAAFAAHCAALREIVNGAI